MRLRSPPSSRRGPIGATHERGAQRERSDISATLRCGAARGTSATNGFSDRADGGFGGGGGAAGGVGGHSVGDQYGLREPRIRAHLPGAGAATASESGAFPCLRRRLAAERGRDARDDAAARECTRQGPERLASAGGRDALQNAECQRASRDSFARFGWRFG